MTTPWNTYGSQTAVIDPQAPAWGQAPQQAAFQQYPPAPAPQFNQGGVPPQGPGFGGYPAFQPQPPKPNKTPLIISLVVAAVVLIGGGVGAFFLLNKSDAATPATNGPAVVTGSNGADGPSLNNPTNATTTRNTPTKDEPTEDEPTKDEPTKPSTNSDATPTSSPDAPATDTPATGGNTAGDGTIATAEALAQAWVGYLNTADYKTASALVCSAQQAAFVADFGGKAMQNQIEVVSLDNGDAATENLVLTIGAVGDTSGSTQIQLNMWPTNTGYFLICDGPLSEADLNWGA